MYLFIRCSEIPFSKNSYHIETSQLIFKAYTDNWFQKQPLEEFYKKKGFLKNFKFFAGKHQCWSLFLIKLQGWGAATLLKGDSNTGVSLWNLQKFSEQLFQRTSANSCFYDLQIITNQLICETGLNYVSSYLHGNVTTQYLQNHKRHEVDQAHSSKVLKISIRF